MIKYQVDLTNYKIYRVELIQYTNDWVSVRCRNSTCLFLKSDYEKLYDTYEEARKKLIDILEQDIKRDEKSIEWYTQNIASAERQLRNIRKRRPR